MHAEEIIIRELYAAYLAAFHRCDATAVATFYSSPCLMVTEQSVDLMADETAIERLFAQLMEKLKLRDYSHSDVQELKVDLLSDRLAQVSGLALRYSKDGKELERTGASYTLRKVDGRWKFVTALAHPLSNSGA